MEHKKVYFCSDELSGEDQGNGVKRQILGYDKTVMMVKVMFEKGAEGSLHHHPHVQTSYVAEGVFEVEVAGEKRILSAGDGFFVPSGKTHGVVCLEKGILIDVFAPCREDFL